MYVIISAGGSTIMGKIKDTPDTPDTPVLESDYMELVGPVIVANTTDEKGMPVIAFFHLIGTPSVMMVPRCIPYYGVEDHKVIEAYIRITTGLHVLNPHN
jgi:hypothetical protein